jgi:hypothetical protein
LGPFSYFNRQLPTEMTVDFKKLFWLVLLENNVSLALHLNLAVLGKPHNREQVVNNSDVQASFGQRTICEPQLASDTRPQDVAALPEKELPVLIQCSWLV